MKRSPSLIASPDTEPRPIVCAALRTPNGSIIAGVRHYDSTMRAAVNALHTEFLAHGDVEQGFLDARGRFLNRREAYAVAVQFGQVKPGGRVASGDRELYSEDLY